MIEDSWQTFLSKSPEDTASMIISLKEKVNNCKSLQM